jgi:hydroxyacylglutathione hydrolase
VLLRQIYDEDLAHAAWLLGCQKTGEAIVFDPARDIDRYLGLADAHGLKITAVAETHVHADFLSGAQAVAQATGATVYLSDHGGEAWSARWAEPLKHVMLRHGDIFRVGGIEFSACHTPGHTPEHLSYMVTDVGGGADEAFGILSGDFVFVGDLGRPDLLERAAGHEGVMQRSAKELASSTRDFLKLKDYLQVLPAHGAGSACGKALGAIPQSTVGYERRFNSAMALVDDEDLFVKSILEGQPAPPLYFARMKTQNRDGVPQLTSMPTPKECEPAELDQHGRVVVDVREWTAFSAGHLSGALWSRTGPFFCASVGSYVMPEERIALVCRPKDVDRLTRCLVRIGLDRVEAWCSIRSFEKAQTSNLIQTTSIEDVSLDQLPERLESGMPVLDVRRTDEYEAGHLAGAINIPHTKLLDRLKDVPGSGNPILVHCQAGVRSAAACSILARRGFDVLNIPAGWGGLEKTTLPKSRIRTDAKVV